MRGDIQEGSEWSRRLRSDNEGELFSNSFNHKWGEGGGGGRREYSKLEYITSKQEHGKEGGVGGLTIVLHTALRTQSSPLC